MKTILLSLVALFISLTITAQKDNIHFNRVICDTSYTINDIIGNADGSFLGVGAVVVGITGGVATYNGCIKKFDSNYNLLWTKIYGGTQIDNFDIIRKISDNRYILGGMTQSIDGDLAAYSWPFSTGGNVWLMIIDSNGNFIHGNTYGYGSQSNISDIEVRSDGGIFVSGVSIAEYGDFASSPAGFLVDQAFVAYTDTQLNKKWLRFIDAGVNEGAFGVSTLDKDDNLILGITTRSNLGDFSGLGSTQYQDVFLFWMDTAQNIFRKMKKTGNDVDLLNNLISDDIGNLYLMVNSYSNVGDFHTPEVKFGTYPSNYLCLLKTDSLGNTLWKHAFGSFDTTILESRDVETNSKGLLLYEGKIWVYARIHGRDSVGEGFAWAPNAGAIDLWILQCDSLGVLENKKRLGSAYMDIPYWINANTISNSILIASVTQNGLYGDDGFNCCNFGGGDFKILKLTQWSTSVTDLDKPLGMAWTISPNPNEGTLQLSFEKEFSGVLKVNDAEGKEILDTRLRITLQKEVELKHLPDGVYYISIANKQGSQVKKLILKK